MARRNRKTFETVQRDKRIYDARLSGQSAMQIAETERVDISTVHRVLKAANDTALLEGREAYVLWNLRGIQEMQRVNFAGMQRGEREASELFLKATQEANRMLGVGAGGTTIDIGGDETTSDGVKVNVNVPKELNVNFVKSSHADEDDGPPPGYKPYSGKVLPYPKLVEHAPSEPEQAASPDVEKPAPVPEDQIGRPGYPKGTTEREPASNPMRPQRAEPPVTAGSVNDQSFVPKNESGLRTEFDIPNVADRFGFGTADTRIFPPPKKPKDD